MRHHYLQWLFTLKICAIIFGALFFLPTPLFAQGEPIVVTGQVIADSGGLPIADVKVFLEENTSTAQRSFEVATTDAQGYYTITEVITTLFTLPGSYHLRFEPPLPYASEYYSDAFTIPTATLLPISVDSPQNDINASLADAAAISGQVLAGDDNQPLEKANVIIFDSSGDFVVGPDYTITDSNGVYTMTKVPPGSYYIRAKPFTVDELYMTIYHPDVLTRVDANPIVVNAGATITEINFSLPLGGMINGRVTSELENHAINPSITVYDQAGEVFPIIFTPSYIDNRDYVITNLLPGSYRLYIEDTTGWHYPEFYDNQESLATATVITITAGQVISDVNAELTFHARARSIATSSALTDTILLTLHNNPKPIYTDDDGQTWKSVYTAPWASAPEVNQSPYVGLAPRNTPGSTKRILALTEVSLYRSGNHGLSWDQQSFKQDNCNNEQTTPIVASPLRPTQLYFGRQCATTMMEPILLAFAYRSNDAGVTWQQIPNLDARQFVASPTEAEQIYVYGLYPPNEGLSWLKSDNAGETWTTVNFPVVILALDAQDSQKLYGLAENNGKRSEDGGETWQDWAQTPCPIVPDGRLALYEPKIIAHPTQSNTIFLRCQQGLYRSNDSGDSWTQLSNTPGHSSHVLAPDYSHPGRILWAKDDGLWASVDNGDTWQVIMPNYSFIVPTQSSVYMLTILTNPVE